MVHCITGYLVTPNEEEEEKKGHKGRHFNSNAG